MCGSAGVPSIADAVAVLEAATAHDPRSLSAARLLTELEELFDLESALHAVQSRRLAVAHELEATVAECGRTTRDWLVEEQHFDPGDAGRRLRLARGLPDAPATAAALADLRIRAEHALTILSVLRHLPDDDVRAGVEAELVGLA